MKGTVGRKKDITPAVLDLMQKMLISDWEVIKEKLINIILQTRGKTYEEEGWVGSSVASILLYFDAEAFVECDLSETNLDYTEFHQVNLTACNLREASLEHCRFIDTVLEQADLRHANLASASFHENNALTCVTISPDGSLIATGGNDGLLNIWDTKTGEHLFTLGRHDDDINDVFFSPDGKYVGDTSDDNSVRIYDLEKKQVLHQIHNESAAIRLFLHRSNLALSHRDGNITIWDLSTHPISLITTFSSGDQSAYSIIFHSQGHSYIAGSNSGLVTLWNVERQKISLQKQCASDIYELCLSPDETLLAIGDYTNGLLLLHAHDLSEIWHLKDIGRIYNPIFTSNGEWIFAACEEEGIVVILARSGINVATFPAHSGYEVAISPDDTFLASVSPQGTIQFWDIRPFVIIEDEPHIPLADYSPTDLSPFFEDSTTWPGWWQKCDLPIPPGAIPNPNFGKCLRTIQYQMNCQGLRLAGAKGLQRAATWFTERGAIMKELSGTRKSKRTKRGASE